MRDGLTEIIHSSGAFKVIIKACNGRDLVAQLEAAKKLPNICMLDISMPVLNGFETLQQIKNRWPSIKTLMVSMFLTEDNIVKALSAGANGVFSKENGGDELIRALKALDKEGFYTADFVPNEVANAAKRKALVPLRLTDRETEFLKLCVSEMTYDEIATKMEVSKRTVESYAVNLCSKLKVSLRQGLMLYAIESGLVAMKKR